MFKLLFASLLLTACATRNTGHSNACDSMRTEIEQKEKVDAKVKSLRKQIRVYKQQNDTASASAAQQTLDILLGYQRDLKESLDQSSQDCQPSFYQAPLPDGK